jgi:hypothetical protein
LIGARPTGNSWAESCRTFKLTQACKKKKKE